LEHQDIALKALLELSSHFEANIAQYESTGYDEANVRVDFIDKMFEFLDWDVRNDSNASERFRDVVREDKIEIGGREKAPDYSFRIGGQRVFFVEAKKPSITIEGDAAAAYQIRRYGYSAKLPVSILTNFEEFAIYDTRIKPNHEDGSAVARLFYCSFREYGDKFSFLHRTFSKQSVVQGNLDRYVGDTRVKKGTAEVDAEFLSLLSDWREMLAKRISAKNPDIDVFQLNHSIQILIDRIVFLRIAEAHDLEEYAMLQKAVATGNGYWNLKGVFALADQKYNSGLFAADDFLNSLVIEDNVFKDMVQALYYPKCPYEFSVLPIEILGKAYEQFLGQTIRLTPAHQVKIEEKPEVKKAGGVFYTPEYIVRYIVQNTVGDKIKNASPKEVTSLSVLDPACGSGSFLIGAYDYLLGWHLDYYVQEKNLKKALKEGRIYQLKREGYLLTIEEKQRILLNNIFGVDIDQQAVEVTRLSLLIRLMEGENRESSGELFKHSDFKLLPNLNDNIKCGNSLISTDFYAKQKQGLFPMDEMRRINAFDWKKEFSSVMHRGGFDCVIGNPPYTYLIHEAEQEYFAAKYKYQDYQKDLYLLFLERYQFLLANGGLLGVIVSNTWMPSLTYSCIRRYLVTSYTWKKILHLPEKVFDAVVDTHVLVLERNSPPTNRNVEFDVDVMRRGKLSHWHGLNMSDLPSDGSPINIQSSREEMVLFKLIVKSSSLLSNLFTVFNGVKPFEKGKGKPPQTDKICKEKPFVVEGKRPDHNWSPLLRGGLIDRYVNLWNKDYWILYGEWLAAPRDPKIFEAPEKIAIRQTGDSLIATLVGSGFIMRNNMHVVLPRTGKLELRYLLGLLNSKLFDFLYTTINPEKGEALAEVKKHHVERLPIHVVDETSKSEVSLRDRLIALVDSMLLVRKEALGQAKTDHDKKLVESQVAEIEKEIDSIVLSLYGLSPEEIELVNARITNR
jgi:hypothetical protein